MELQNYADTLNEAAETIRKTYVDQPQFIIKKGKVLDTQQEFAAFKRANITKWGAIQHVINCLERYIGQYNVTFAHIDCVKVLHFAEQEFEALTDEDLFAMIINKQQVWDSIMNPKFKFKGPMGPVLAAIHIQKNYRRFKAYSAYA